MSPVYFPQNGSHFEWARAWACVFCRSSKNIGSRFSALLKFRLVIVGFAALKHMFDASFRSLPWGKWSFVELFELPVANMSKATYHDIRNLCRGVFSSKQTLRFASASIKNQLRISGDSTSLRSQTWDLWHSTDLFSPASEGRQDECRFWQVTKL